MIQLVIVQTGKGYAPKEERRIFDKSIKSFPDMEAAKAYLSETYPKCKRQKMFADGKDGKARHIGYIYSFHNSDISHVPVEKWIQQDWVEFREVKSITLS